MSVEPDRPPLRSKLAPMSTSSLAGHGPQQVVAADPLTGDPISESAPAKRTRKPRTAKPKPEAPPPVPESPARLRMGSVNWDESMIVELDVISAREQIPKHALHNTMLRRFLNASETEQNELVAEARDWWWHRQRR